MTSIIEIWSTLPIQLTKANILCFNQWTDPENFYSMPRKERIELMNKYRHIAVDPTESNHWVWFGSYTKKRLQPRFHDMSVPSLLYNIFIEKTNVRLYGKLVLTRSDVNPYKYMKGSVNLKEYLKLLRKDTVADETAHTIHGKQKNSDIKKCLERIDEIYDADMDFNRDWFVEVLTANGYEENTINEALKQTDKQIKV